MVGDTFVGGIIADDADEYPFISDPDKESDEWWEFKARMAPAIYG